MLSLPLYYSSWSISDRYTVTSAGILSKQVFPQGTLFLLNIIVPVEHWLNFFVKIGLNNIVKLEKVINWFLNCNRKKYSPRRVDRFKSHFKDCYEQSKSWIKKLLNFLSPVIFLRTKESSTLYPTSLCPPHSIAPGKSYTRGRIR